MARVKSLKVDQVPEDLRGLYRKFSGEYGLFGNQVAVLAHRPPALRHIPTMVMEMVEEAVVDRRYIEIAVLTVSKINECKYCVSHHGTMAVDAGLSAEATRKILDPDCPELDEVDRLVRDYAVEVTNGPRYISDELFEILREHFSEEQIVELTLRTALCGFFNRFNEALRIEIEDGVMEQFVSRGLED